MPRYDFENATIAHQDYGTGLDPEEDPGPISAAFMASGRDAASDHVVAGLEPAVDWESGRYGTLSLSAGVALLSFDGDVTVQAEPGGADSYDRTWHGPITFPVSVPPVDDLELERGENAVYLAIDPGENDAASIVYGVDVDEPDEPSLQRAVVDTDDRRLITATDGDRPQTAATSVSLEDYSVGAVENEYGETHVAFRFGEPEDE